MRFGDTGFDELAALFDKARDAHDSERNRVNMAKWERKTGERNTGEGITEGRAAGERLPDGAFHVFLGASYISGALDVNMTDYYFDPVLYLKTNLRVNLMRFEKFMDDTALTKTVPWNPGVTMEPSLFGVKAVYQPDKEAWESHESYLVSDYSDLASLKTPDFYDNEAMRHIHSMYRQLCEITDRVAPDFSISFPRWRRSPFGNACSLRGMERLCLDFYENPDFVHELMSFVTCSRMEWENSCNSFLGQSCNSCILANDEVNCPTVSPSLYEQFIMPYEKQLIEYYGEFEYFHSCGDLTALIPYIKTLEPKLFQVSPWTGLDAACDAFSDTGTVLDVWVHVSADVMNATPEHTQRTMKQYYETCRNSGIAGFQFNSGNIQRMGRNIEDDDEKIIRWAEACRSAGG